MAQKPFDPARVVHGPALVIMHPKPHGQHLPRCIRGRIFRYHWPVMTPVEPANFYDVMFQRGLVAQCTEQTIRQRFADPQGKPVRAYIGFDPTADSLHIGSLVPIMGLAWLQRCGHKPIVLVGGATGLIGDPSGKTEARRMLSREDVNRNAQAIAAQIARIVRFDQSGEDTATGAVLVNNADWFADMRWLDVLREVGSRMSVNRMLTMDSVKGRLQAEGEGISYLEFSYMLMQAYDFHHLYRNMGCTVQMGGQDQWGNIVMGIELIRRMHSSESHSEECFVARDGLQGFKMGMKHLAAGLTFPLVTKSDGGKFGKSEQGNVWLDANRTSPYQFYQFWRNAADADVGRFLRYFTFLPVEEIEQLESLQGAQVNQAKQRLAYELTRLVHGQAEAQSAADAAHKAFGEARDVTAEAIPHGSLAATELEAGLDIRDLMVRAGLAASNGEAKRLIQGGGVSLHDEKVTDIQRRVTEADVRDGYILLRAGKKRLFRFDVQ